MLSMETATKGKTMTTQTQTTIPGLFDFGVKREFAHVTPLRAYPGWNIRKWVDEFGRFTFDAVDTRGLAISPLEPSFEDALYFVKHDEPPLQDDAWAERALKAAAV